MTTVSLRCDGVGWSVIVAFPGQSQLLLRESIEQNLLNTVNSAMLTKKGVCVWRGRGE